MARAVRALFAFRNIAAILVGALLGTFLGFASAQDTASGWLDADCDTKFCGDVCWVPDPNKVAETENVDWKCVGQCSQRGGKARDCLASCRRY
jgi:hypothetical protein